mgnify:CR=1 FL=1
MNPEENPTSDYRAVTADMTVDAAIKRYPRLATVFLRLAINCPQCHISRFHDIESASEKYGIDLDLLLDELNEAVESTRR